MNDTLRAKKTFQSWVFTWLCLSILISTLFLALGGVNLELVKRGNNLQSGDLSSRGAPFVTNLDRFWLNFTFNNNSAAKGQLRTTIQYPEIYELQIQQLQLLSPFGNVLLSFKLQQKTQLIDLLKIDRNLALPIAVNFPAPAYVANLGANLPQPTPSEIQFKVALLKLVMVFSGLGLIFAFLGLVRQAYLNYINLPCSNSPADNAELKIFFSLMLFCGIWSLIRGPDFNWDLQNYHYYNPFAFLHNRYNWDIDPVGIHSYFNPLLDIPSYLLITFLPMRLSSFILGAVSGVFAFGVYKIICLLYQDDPFLSQLKQQRPQIHRASILLSLLIAISGFASATQIGTTMNENFIAIPLIWAYYWLLRFNVSRQAKALYFGGILIGVAVALKLTAITFAVAFVASFMLVYPRQIISRRFVLLVLMVFLGFFVLNGIWMWKMTQVFQNPFFPNLGVLNPASAVHFERDTTFLAKDLSHWLFLPFYLLIPSHLTSEQSVSDPRLALCFVLLICCSYSCRAFFKNKLQQLLLINFLLGYLFWLLLFSIQRYTIPLEVLGSILIFSLLNYLLAGRAVLNKLLPLLAIVIFATTKWGNFNHLSYRQKFTDLGVVASQLPENSLVVFGNYPLAYLGAILSPSNHYINRPDAASSQYNFARKQALVNDFIQKGQPIYLIDKNPEEMRRNSQSWLSNYHLSIGSCLSLANSARQLICQLN